MYNNPYEFDKELSNKVMAIAMLDRKLTLEEKQQLKKLRDELYSTEYCKYASKHWKKIRQDKINKGKTYLED